MFGEFGQEQLHMAKKIQRSARRSAFFKVLTGDFSQQLRIPSAFIKNFNRCLLQKFRLKGPSGQCWDVKFEKRGNQLFFYRGWENFVKHHPLEVGDFLIFSYDGVSIFNVRIYGKTFCDKNVKTAKRICDSNGIAARRSDVLPMRSDSGKRRAIDQAEETPFRFQSDNAFVCRTLKKSSSLYEVNVPIAVIRKEGYRAGETLKIKDAFGNKFWYVKLCCTLDGIRLLMRSGIARICQEMKTSPGDSVVFEFVKRGVVQLHIIRACRKLLAASDPWLVFRE